jgi:RNA polymerase sigma-70 factor (ECF subfamily)
VQSQDALDVGQEVFRAVFDHIADFRKERPSDSFRGWLWTITRNKIRDHYRDQKARIQAAGGSHAQDRLAAIPDEPPVSPPGDETGGANAALRHRAMEMVRAGSEERTWKAFWRVNVDGLTAAEVAQELGMSVSAVYVAGYRVRQRLRREFEGLLD